MIDERINRISLDEAMIEYGLPEVAQIMTWADKIAGAWNGKDERGEDKAQCALNIKQKCEELSALLEEMSEYL